MNVYLETERLILRSFRDGDLDEYAAIFGDPDVMRFLGGKPMSRQDAWRNMAMIMGHWHFRGFGFFAVEEKASGRLVGRVGHWQPEGWPGFEIGWAIGPDFWGRGYAREAALFCRDYAFEVMGREAIISSIHPDNVNSIRLAERIGETYWRDDQVMEIPVRLYRLTRETWSGLRR